jgi:PKD repeat protein
MRTGKLTLAISAVLFLTGCTVKDVDVPSLAGPSTVGFSIDLQSNTNTLIRDGLSQARITINARDHMGQPLNGRPLRAEIRVNGVVEDFGTLSTKNPVTGSTLIYTAPPSSALSQERQTITIAVTPTDSGVFGDEFARAIELILLPQGVILPTNPTLAASFTFNPTAPKVLDVVTFDASLSENAGSSCGNRCFYSWNFGDGATGSGQFTTHEFRRVGSYSVTLTVTDSRGVQANATRLVTVAAGTPPTIGTFTFSPTEPAPGQQVFFNASAARPAPGRNLVDFFWDFGDGTTGTGQTESHVFSDTGTYTVTLKVTDDAGAFSTTTREVTVGVPEEGQ